MQLNHFHQQNNDQILIQPDQASRFAKQIANDFNPIHDPDSPRFCVPGDLLFALVLAKYGLSQHMTFHFTGMVNQAIPLHFPQSDDETLSVTDEAGKEYLQVTRSGDINDDAELISSLTQHYVAFSGKNFPDLIVPLMHEHQVMIHPDRPLVIYESMHFDLQTLDFHQAQLELTGTKLEVMGKKGKATLEFLFRNERGDEIGTGHKRLALRGLVPYEQSAIDAMVNLYEERRVKLAA